MGYYFLWWYGVRESQRHIERYKAAAIVGMSSVNIKELERRIKIRNRRLMK